VSALGWRAVAVSGGLLAGVALAVGAYYSAKTVVELVATLKTIKDAR
jgi:hypothetical protein